MVASLRHRGPDESGTFVAQGVGLGLARLSIVDVAEGHQPVFSEDGSVVAVCNGEIYNFRDLATRLVARGHRLRSGSDVEVIPHLYEEYGADFVNHLRGMFAIALWDASRGQLILARDRVGKKPLLYARAGRGLVFASEVRALLVAGHRRTASLEAIDHVLAFGYVPLDGAGHEGVHALPPGHVLTWRDGTTGLTRYWQWQPGQEQVPRLGLGDDLETVLDEAVRLRLVSERPLGAFLSGGIDSTVVTALMTRHHDGPVRTFSIGFDDPAYDESPHARAVADFLGTQHHELIVHPDPDDFLPMLQSAFDQPFADSSAIPTLLLTTFASEHVTVALSGDGGDEVFGGYERYRAAPALQRVNSALGIGHLAKAPLEAASRRLHRPRLARLARSLNPSPSLAARYRNLMLLVSAEERERLWTSEARAQIGSSPEARFDRLWRKLESLDPVATMRAVDVATYLPGDLLTKVDVASMAHSLEVRSPLLDQEVMALAASMPPGVLVRHRQTKWILREFARRLVPAHLIDRPKQGFGIPRAAWLRGPLREATRDLLLGHTARQRGWFRADATEAVLIDHDRGTDRDAEIWPLLMVELWARGWVDAPGAHTVT